MKFLRLKIFLKYLLFWYLFFVLARIYFLLFNLSEIASPSFVNYLKTFVFGFKLDISLVAYIGLLVSPIFIISCFSNKTKFLKLSLNIITGLLLVIFSLIIIGDAEVYHYWGFRLDDTPLHYLKTPQVMVSSSSSWRMVFLVFLYLDLVIGAFLFYFFLIIKKLEILDKPRYESLSLIIISLLLIISLRGGFTKHTVNLGSAYFSDDIFLNHAAINVVWNASSAFFADDIEYSRFQYFDESNGNSLFQKMFVSTDSCENILTKKPKKIVLVILESFTSKALSFDNIGNSCMPKLHEWKNKGILFDNFYANGDRSEKGMAAILSACPSVPGYSVLFNTGMSTKLPSISASLAENGYKTSFYYGGDLKFANLWTYLNAIGFERLVSKSYLDFNCVQNHWGLHDECMFKVIYDDIILENDTSFFTLFTLSSHEPYIVPFVSHFGNSDEAQRTKNAYYYTDSCLNDFLVKLEQSPEWEDMLVILVSDHGTRFDNVKVMEKEKFKIFMLWTGGSIYENFKYSKIGSQVDIAASLLSMLNINHDEFIFSQNLFSSNSPNVFYAFNHGYGFMKDSSWLLYDLNPEKFTYKVENTKLLETYANTYMQKIAYYYKSLENR